MNSIPIAIKLMLLISLWSMAVQAQDQAASETEKPDSANSAPSAPLANFTAFNQNIDAPCGQPLHDGGRFDLAKQVPARGCAVVTGAVFEASVGTHVHEVPDPKIHLANDVGSTHCRVP